MDGNGDFNGSLFSCFAPFPIMWGLTSIFLFATYGALYLNIRVPLLSQQQLLPLLQKLQQRALRLWIPSFVLFGIMSLWTLFTYLREHSLILLAIITVVALILMLITRMHMRKGHELLAFFCWAMFLLVVVALFLGFIFPYLAPPSLTIFNASSSEKTLTTMLFIVLLAFPAVIVYTVWIYRVFTKRISVKEGGRI
ncbi:MAG: cytochrome d ubiquinol oxidase subunit II [Oligoflexia bacterium]|nr:cytochrome d ubiquinol oxidase subunit II [Oligoflexia bacterium]